MGSDVSISQSRCFSFQANNPLTDTTAKLFQSRNRDAFHFRRIRATPESASQCFNLAIEMLFISGLERLKAIAALIEVSISQSRCFSFQVMILRSFRKASMNVSISQSRCFSFQEGECDATSHRASLFQSRNRDAFHFRFVVFAATTDSSDVVSISQSRCFSFQVIRSL